MRTILSIFIACCLAAAHFMAIAAPVQIGKKNIEIPTPQGYGRVPADMTELLSLLDSFTPPNNQSLALFLSEQDLAVAMSGEVPDMTRRFVVQVPKVAIDYNFTQADFEVLKAKARADLERTMANIKPRVDGLMDQASSELSGKLGSQVEVGLESLVPLPIHHETPNSLSMSVLSRYSVGIKDGESVTEVAAGTLNFIRVKNTMFMLLLYGSKDDLEWTREQSKSWIQAVTAANMAP